MCSFPAFSRKQFPCRCSLPLTLRHTLACLCQQSQFGDEELQFMFRLGQDFLLSPVLLTWPVVSLFISHSLLKIEIFQIKIERCIDLVILQ